MPPSAANNLSAASAAPKGKRRCSACAPTTVSRPATASTEATAAETAAAAEAAAAAFAPYLQLSAELRANFLDAIAEEIDALDDVFFAFAMQETACPVRG